MGRGTTRDHEGPERTAGIVSAGNLQAICRHSQFMERSKLLLTELSEHIHPASRGVAAHTAGLFRSVRGAKGGFPPWGLPKLRIFTFPPRGGSPS